MRCLPNGPQTSRMRRHQYLSTTMNLLFLQEPVPAEVLAYQEKRLLDHNTRWSVLRFAVDVAAFGITAELIAREIRAGQGRWERPCVGRGRVGALLASTRGEGNS